MEVIVSRGCGLDVHQATVVACLLIGELERLPRQQVKTFTAMTYGLIELRDWLEKADCTAEAMDETGVYWKPVHNLLEGHFDLVIANADHYHIPKAGASVTTLACNNAHGRPPRRATTR